MNSGWRKVDSSEIFEPGRRFRINLTTGETYVWEDDVPVGTAVALPSELDGIEWREFTKGTGGNPLEDIPTYGSSADSGGDSGVAYGFQTRVDPLSEDPQFRETMESYYKEWVARYNQQHPESQVPWSFDEFWNAQADNGKKKMYNALKREYKRAWSGFSKQGKGVGGMDAKTRAAYDENMREAMQEAMVAGMVVEGGKRRKTTKKIREPDGKGGWTDKTVEVEETQDPTTGEWREVPPRGATPWEIRYRVKEAQARMGGLESQIKNLEMQEKLRPQIEELNKRSVEEQVKSFKRADTQRKIDVFNKVVTQPATEIIAGGMRAVAGDRMSATKYGKGAMKVAQQSFVPSPGTGTYRESPLRPAPRARFTTPMVTSIPSRMPITTTRGGKKIPAGEAVIAPARMVKEAIVKPTVAGSLLTTSVGKMPAAQALVPQRPTRLGLSNLRVNVDTSGIRRSGALPRLKIKKNLYNEQLRKIRGLLR